MIFRVLWLMQDPFVDPMPQCKKDVLLFDV
jgi:hypothetical protein